ncbi:hypothetical protein E3T25_03260 [Cryobacterium sandaracinum]|uniref:N-acetyltransferase n=1 Tax=Cryobacterium sandaracinum TaxID=1259247 RepID=A0ABY2JL38_9MICO|nr:hypothetical protein E3T25_03260 [Cryobacterium sandaracinum]
MRRLSPQHRAVFVALLTEHPQAEVEDTPELHFDDTIDLQSDSKAFALVAETDDGRLLGAIAIDPGTTVVELMITVGSSEVCQALLNTLAPARATCGFAQVHATVPPEFSEGFRSRLGCPAREHPHRVDEYRPRGRSGTRL